MADKGEREMANSGAISDRASSGKSLRGFASMDERKQREIASRGGRAAHEKGTAHEFDADQAREAGRKGGEAISRDRDHMARIGRRGGESVSNDRNHMAQIGRRGGEAVSSNREHMARIGRKGGEAVSANRQHMSAIGREGGSARSNRGSEGQVARSGSSFDDESTPEDPEHDHNSEQG